MTQATRLTITDFLQIPFAIGSFIFFNVVKLFMRGFVAAINRARRGKPPVWRIVSGELLGKPMTLPVFMTKAPRWNTHAIIAMAGPLKIESSVDINVAQANKSATTWSLSLQPLQSGKEVRLSSVDVEKEESWISLETPSGYYTAVIRYYNVSETPSLPEIKIDGQVLVDVMPLDANTNQFYKHLHERKNWFYSGLNFYAYTMLRFRKWLPDSFVNKQYLPAGDAEMTFKYGDLRQGAALQINLKADLLSAYDVFFTQYSRASFPVYWREITEQETTTPVSEKAGYYLIRFLQKPGAVKISIEESFEIATVVVAEI